MGRKQRRSSLSVRKQADDTVLAPETKPVDLVLIHGKTEDGKGLRVLRMRDDQLEAGAVQPLEEGKPIHGEVVRLHPRAEQPLLCDVEVAVPAPRPSRADSDIGRKGPPRVASERYRRNWDAIWSGKKSGPLN